MIWRNAYFQQAWSDFKVYQDLNNRREAFCHQLHYLQMTTEKLAKGFQCVIGSGPHPMTHFVFVDFLQGLKRQPRLFSSRMRFKTMKQFSLHVQSLLPVANLIEQLAPAGGNYSRINPEYPWTDATGNVYSPVMYGFPEFRRREREISLIQNFLRNLFQLEGYI